MSAMSQEAYVCFTPEDSTMTFYFDDLRSTRTGTTYSANTGGNRPSWYYDGTCRKVALVVFDPSFADARITRPAQWFVDFTNMRSIIGMEYWDMSEATSVSWMFSGCKSLTSIDLSHFNTANSTSLNRLFMGCESLTSIDLSNFNTDKVTDMSYMFGGCSGLTSLDLSPLNTENVTTMEHMLSGLGLTSIDLSPLNTSKVKNMSGMLYGSKRLKSIDLSCLDMSEASISPPIPPPVS